MTYQIYVKNRIKGKRFRLYDDNAKSFSYADEIAKELAEMGCYSHVKLVVNDGGKKDVIIYKWDDSVVTECYGNKKTWKNRKDAEKFFLDGIMNSEGSEQERYIKIYTALKDGYYLCSDRY